MKGKKRALALNSGGLDSALAMKLILDQGVEIVALHFVSPFDQRGPHSPECDPAALQVARHLKVEYRELEKGLDFAKIVEQPRFGHGRHLNPCIDCRIYLLQKAGELLEREQAAFIITGEVLGQRPMSQRRDTMNVIERESGLKGLILRPLSARHFPPTQPELEGLVDRERLLDIAGRSRKVQLKLAEELNLTGFSAPAGGCLLTDAAIARRLQDLLHYHPDYQMQDLEQLRYGRHFRIHPGLKIIVGRHEAENQALEKLIGDFNTAFAAQDYPGPTIIVKGVVDQAAREKIGAILRRYLPRASEQPILIKECRNDAVSEFITSAHLEAEELEAMRI